MCRSSMAASPYRLHEEPNVPRPYGGRAPARGTSAHAEWLWEIANNYTFWEKIENSSTHDFALYISA